jgi:hypothetical protein
MAIKQQHLNAQDFYTDNINWLQKFRFACNFNPTHLDWLIATGQISKSITPKTVVDFLKKHNIKQLRMGIHLDHALKLDEQLEHPQADLSYYQPWLDSFAMAGIQVILCAGIKSPRWPEIHLSEDLLMKLYGGRIPHAGYVIDLNDPLAKFALAFQKDFFTKLSQKNYHNIVAIQPENEPLNQFGIHHWTIHPEVILAEVDQVLKFFPSVEVLLNSSIAGGQIDRSAKILNKALSLWPQITTCLGINLYLVTPRADFFHRIISTFTNLIRSNGLKLLPKINQTHRLEVTEWQFERWLDDRDHSADLILPGSNFAWMCDALTKTARILYGKNFASGQNNTTPINLSLWGVEEFIVACECENPKSNISQISQLIELLNRVK